MVRMLKQFAIVLLVVAAVCTCKKDPGPVAPPPDPVPPAVTRVLFIGNSLTQANDLTGLVDSIAAAVGVPWAYQVEAVGGYGLEDHWLSTSLPRTIATGKWNWVVLQQGPSALPESRVNLVYWTQQFNARIRAAGAHTALYMVWPDATRMSAFDSVSASYRAAATAVGGTILPAGDAWLAAWRRDATLPLYGPDQFHPSIAGSYLAALTIFGGLTGRSPLDVPLRPAGLASVLSEFSDAQLRNLRAAAAEVLAAAPLDARVPKRPSSSP
jgi:hypothetical protein